MQNTPVGQLANNSHIILNQLAKPKGCACSFCSIC